MTTTKRIAAALVVAALAAVPSVAQASSLPPIAPLKPIAVKWILPPKGSPLYEQQKAWAEANGYETVDFEDRTYPSRP
jgi:hypothetical protein